MKKLILLLFGTFMAVTCIFGIVSLSIILWFANFEQGKSIVVIIFLFFISLSGTVAYKCFKYICHNPFASKTPTWLKPFFEQIPIKKSSNSVAPTNISHDEYVEFDNILQRVDGQPISDDEVPYLIQVGYERALDRDNALINLSEQEERFFDELQKSLSEINRTITMERLSNGAISVYANSCYVGRIRLTGRKHWMQILRGLTQNKTIYGELDELIQHIPEWIRYIRLHCK